MIEWIAVAKDKPVSDKPVLVAWYLGPNWYRYDVANLASGLYVGQWWCHNHSAFPPPDYWAEIDTPPEDKQ